MADLIKAMLVIATAVAASRPSTAQEPPPGPPPPLPKDQGIGVRVSGGFAITEGIDTGAFGRIEFERFTVGHRNEGLIGGVLFGGEGWGSANGGGGGIPFAWYGGYRARGSIFATLGLGWDFVVYDRVRGDGGFGIFAPMTIAHAGVDLGRVRILADGRAQYRWNWGAEDRYQLEAGIALSFTNQR